MQHSLSYIVWKFHSNRLIFLRVMQENKGLIFMQGGVFTQKFICCRAILMTCHKNKMTPYTLCDHKLSFCNRVILSDLLMRTLKTAEQRTIIQKYGDWYTGRWLVDCCIWYSEGGAVRAAVPPSPAIAVPNVTAHPSAASVPTSYYSLCTIKG